MGNDVRIEVHWDDPDGAKFQAAQKAKAKKAGEAAGDAFTDATRAKVKKGGEQAADDFDGSFSGKLTKKSIAAAQKAGQEAAESFTGSFNGNLDDELAKVSKTVEEELGKAKAPAAKVGEEVGQAAGDGVEKGMRDGARKGGKATNDEMSRVAGRANKAFDAKLFAGLSLGMPAAAAVGAVGTVGALALIPAAIIGVSAMLLSNNAQVAGSFGSLASDVTGDAKQMAQVMAGPLAGAGSDLKASWDRLRPSAEALFKATAPEVETLTGAVTDLAEGAMPGLVTSAKAAHPALLGVRVLAGEAGRGLGEFFANASQGSAGAGQGMTVFAGTVRLLEARLGTLFANLASGSSGPLTQLHVIVDQATGALLDLTAKGSAATSFLGGFGSAAGGTVTALRGVLTLLNSLPPGVANFAGSLTAATMIGQKFGVDLGAQFSGLGTRVKNWGNDLKGVEKFAAKAGTAIGTLAAGAVSPATLAVAALGAGLMILGERQQAAATEAAGHAARERDLAAALRESKGAITESVRATAAKKLADYQVSDGTRNLIADTQKLAGEGGVKMLTDGYLGNAEASKKLVAQLRQTTTEHTHAQSVVASLGTQFDHFGTTLDGNTGAMDDTGFAAKQLADIIEASGGDFAKAQEQMRALGLATSAGEKPMNALESAMEGLKDAASGSEEKLSALVDVLNILEGRNASFEESIQSGNDTLRTMEDSLKKGIEHADGFGKSLLNADGSLNTFSANGSQLQDVASSLQTSFAKAGTSIDEMVRKGMPFDQAVAKVNGSLQTQRDRFIEIANKMGIQGKAAEDLADKYGLLPQEISTRVTADTKQAQDAINALPAVAANTHGAVPISADVDRATNKISTVVQYADGSTGVITVDGNKDPATGKVMVAVQYANGQHTYMTVDAFNQAAKDRTLEAKRNADGTVAYILVDAKAGAADAAIDWAARARTATIYVQTKYSGVGTATPTSAYRAFAKGGMVGYASGGEVMSVPRFAGGGQRMLDITRGGIMRGPGTGTSDSILALSSRGPIAGSDGEMVIRASQTRKWRPLLEDINNGVNGFASGGMVKSGEVSRSEWEALYAAGWRGNPNDGMEALYAPPATAAPAVGHTSVGGYRSATTGTPTREIRLVIDVTGGDREFRDMIRRWVKRDGGGDVQVAFGRG